MEIFHNNPSSISIFKQLTHAGYLRQQFTPTAKDLYCWRLSREKGSNSYLHTDGKRYWGIDLSGMLPLYQEIYQKIYTERLENWGLAGYNDVGLLYANSLLLIWGPDEFMQAKRPATIALQRIEAADQEWVDWLEQWWHETALDWEKQLDSFWLDLCKGEITVETFQAVIEGKVKLNAIGVDSLMPSRQQVEAWLSPHITPSILKEVIEGCLLPASGYLAFDLLEVEHWKLTASYLLIRRLSDDAQVQFIQYGLFYLYEALNNTRKDYFFYQYPVETAMKYSQAISGQKAIQKRLEEIEQRNWQRRYHHEWARQQIEAITDLSVRKQMILLHYLLGTARDFDEEKRRLNMKLWRSLFALADGLKVKLIDLRATIACLAHEIKVNDGNVTIDPVFTRKVSEERLAF